MSRNGARVGFVKLRCEFFGDTLTQSISHLTWTGEALGYRLTGPTNAGKTAAVIEFRRRNPGERTVDGLKCPVVYVHVRERSNLDEVYIEILNALGDPAALDGTPKKRKQRIRTLLLATGVKMVIIDEPHHLTDSRSEGAKVALIQLGKTIKDWGICVVFSGVKSVDGLTNQSDELARRFRAKLSIERYDISRPEVFAMLRRFCDGLGAKLKYVEPEKFGSDNKWFARLLGSSNAVIGVIPQLVYQAESRAQAASETKLTLKHFSQAWEMNFASSNEENLSHLRGVNSKRLKNLFEADDTTVASVVGEMATR